MDHAYWLSPTNAVPVLGSEGQPVQNVAKPKETNVGAITQPTMASFANIFAGASAAIASSANIIDVNTDLLQSGKNFMVSPAGPSLNQIEIQSSNQLSKRSGVFPIACTLPGMATISNIGLANANMIISGTPAQLSGDIQQITSGQITFASAPQMTVAISKDFIQQAAAESGVTIGLNNNNNTVQAQIYTEQPLIQTTNAVTLTNELAPLSFPPDPNAELEKPIKCPECDMTFKQTGALTYHTFVAHAQLQERPHKCIVCPESFLAAHHLQDHIKAVHCVDSQTATNLTCSECHMTFNNGGSLNYHIYMAHTIHGSRTLQHMCHECGKSFMKANLLAAHIKNVHGTTVSISAGINVAEALTQQKQYPCQSCDKVFKLPHQLKQHALSSHDKPHKCEICGKGFGRKSDLNRHTRGVHMRERPHSCSKCGWTFAEAGNLKHHMQAVHTKEKNYQCTICSRSFAIPSYLKTHMIRVHGMVETSKASVVTVPAVVAAATTTTVTINQPNYIASAETNNSQNNITAVVTLPQAQVTRCFECGQVFPNAAMLQNHVMSTHPQPFWCTVCGEAFSQAYQLQNHLQLRHSDSNTNNLSTINQAQLSQPAPSAPIPAISTAQSNANNDQVNPQPERCTECGIVLEKGKEHLCPGVNKYQQVAFNAASALSTAPERPHLCTKCGKGFKTATHLKQHVRCVHTKDRPHKCQRCAKSFARMSDLNRHVKGVHEKVKTAAKALRLTNSKCTECGRSFSETSHLKRHFLTVHLNQRPSFKCADCQEGFPDEQSFKNHICHERERPHTCTICTKRFAEVTQLRRHMRSAHNQLGTRNKHRCDQCRRTFTRPVDLERHVHAVHLKEKPHKCGYCNKYFGLHGNLNKHIRAVHMLEKPHQCVECGKCFAHIGVLKRHLRDIHFYDRRPAHNNPKLKNRSNVAVENRAIETHVIHSLPQDGSRQPDDVSHLVVLQALESIHQDQQHQIIAQSVQAQTNLAHHSAPQVVQPPPQILTESVPPPPPTPI